MADLFRPRLEGIFGPTQPVFQPSRNLFGDQARSESDIGMEGRMQGQFESQPIQLGQIQPDRMQETFSPETYFQDLYRKTLEGMPQREDPNIWRRLGSIFMPNREEQERFKYAPYERKMGDFESRLKAIEPGLTAERYANTNERAIRSSEMQNEAANRRIDVQERNIASQEEKRRADIERDRERTGIQKNRAETYRYRTENPNNQMFEDKDGNILAFNPQTKKTEYLLDPETGQPIKSNILSPYEKQQLQLELIRERALESRRLEGMRTSNDLRIENQRASNRIGAIREQGAQSRATKTTSPNEGNVQTTTQTTQVKDPTGKVTGTRTQTTQRSTQKGSNVGVKMRAPNGRIVLVPKDKVEEAKKQGGKVVP